MYSELLLSMSCVTVAVKIRETATLENATYETRLEFAAFGGAARRMAPLSSEKVS